jgi:soluble lytic murein transglycosylase-like protein
MPRLQATLRALAALIAVVALVPLPLAAQETAGAEARYAAILRAINPHLKAYQSVAFARSILANAERNRLDPQLLTALVTVESAWRPNAISRAGARGLGQLMPATAQRLGVNAADPAENLHGAAAYLRAMLDRFANRGANTVRLALGAYNAGPRAVEQFHGIPPYGETQNYVRKVLRTWRALGGRIAKVETPPAAPDEQTWLSNTEASALAGAPAASAPDLSAR